MLLALVGKNKIGSLRLIKIFNIDMYIIFQYENLTIEYQIKTSLEKNIRGMKKIAMHKSNQQKIKIYNTIL